MTTNYDRIARFYDVDMARNMPFDDAGFYARLCAGESGRALELGCGNGRIFFRLLAHGVDTVGIDASAEMLRALRATAERQGIAARVCRMDIRALGFAGASFDVVLCPYSLLTYLTTDADLARALAEVRRVLRPRGAFVADAFVPRPVVASTEFRTDYRRPFGRDTLVRAKRITPLSPRGNRIERRYRVEAADGSVLEQVDVSEEIRPFAPDELRGVLADAGFAVEQAWWDYASSDPGPDAQFHTVLARR
jgi:SAM-dependent methyltransferase